jgi:hypothetical protein
MEDLSISLSLLALTACLAHGGWLAICLLMGRRQIAVSSLPTAMLLSCSLLLATGMSWAATESFPIPTSGQLLVLLAITLWLAVRFGWKMFSQNDWNVARWRSIGVAHAILLAAAAWSFHTTTRGESSDVELRYDQIAKKVPVDDAVVVTDQGRIFSVFRFDTNDHTFQENSSGMFQDRLVRVAAPDLGANCHGWVFVNGRYAIPEAAVTALLQDNGYAEVTAPQPNDVIVYRDDAGRILHSGRVRRVHEDGQVWIESKWGAGGRYLHLPEDQCYSPSFAYYRSARPSHDAQVVQTPVTKDARVARSDSVPQRRARG